MNLAIPLMEKLWNLCPAAPIPAPRTHQPLSHPAAPARHLRQPGGEWDVVPYRSLVELRNLLVELPQAQSTTVIAVLDAQFAGHLPSLVERAEFGYRLVLVSLSGRWGASVGDLVVHSRRSGWEWIVCEREVAAALAGTLESRRPDEKIVVYWPAWRELDPACR